jgi:hypothetical protein
VSQSDLVRGVLAMVEIKEIRDALTLYYMRRLADDDAERSQRPPRAKEDYPEWSTLDKLEADPDFGLDDYHEFLIDELKFGLMKNPKFVQKLFADFGINVDINSDDFKSIYREYIKAEIEIVKIIQERVASNYTDEMRFLYGDDTGLSSAAVSLCDLSLPRSSIYHDHIEQKELKQTQLKHSQEGVQAKKQKDDKKYAKFNECVLEELNTWQGSSSGQWLAQHCKRHVEIIENSPTKETLRKRADKIKKQYLASK